MYLINKLNRRFTLALWVAVLFGLLLLHTLVNRPTEQESIVTKPAIRVVVTATATSTVRLDDYDLSR